MVMAGLNESYSIIIFRGTRANPIRLKLQKSYVKKAFIVGCCLLLIQVGIVTHYVYQRNQLEQLSSVQEELLSTQKRTSTFAERIDGMKKQMLALELLNRKLQTMFGLKPDGIDTASTIPGKGGEELPYENTALSFEDALGNLDISPNESTGAVFSPSTHDEISKVNQGLVWLNQHVTKEQRLLHRLSKTGQQRVKRWASTPSIWPVKGPITSRFGPRVSPFTGKRTLHAGIDIGVPTGTPIHAPANGKVVIAAHDTRIGNFIRIDHGFGIETTYGHLSKILVKYGQRVKRDQVIGLVGSTGTFSTGPHLHYKIAVKDKVTNPLRYILN